MLEILNGQYHLTFVEIEFIQQVEAEVYLLKDTHNRKFKIKVYKNLSKDKEQEIEQIYQWTTYLENQLSVPFSKIIKSNKKHTFIPIGEQKGCLYEWIDWEIIEKFDIKYAYQIGQLLRVIHNTTKTYNGPISTIKKIDSNWINSAKQVILEAAKNRDLIPIEKITQLANNLDFLSIWLSTKAHKSTFGLIHSDLHRRNIIFKEEKLSFLDFDDAVFSSYLLDIAVILNEFADFPAEFEQLQIALLQGYKLEMNKNVKQDLYYFRKIADIIYAEWVFKNRKEGTLPTSKVAYGFEAITSLIQM